MSPLLNAFFFSIGFASSLILIPTIIALAELTLMFFDALMFILGILITIFSLYHPFPIKIVMTEELKFFLLNLLNIVSVLFVTFWHMWFKKPPSKDAQ